jgi:hypothetical protein
MEVEQLSKLCLRGTRRGTNSPVGTSDHHARSDGGMSPWSPPVQKSAKVGHPRTEQFVSRIASRAEIPAHVRRALFLLREALREFRNKFVDFLNSYTAILNL